MGYKLYSHPETLLKDHLQLVTKIGMDRFLKNKIFMQHEALMRVILTFHDLGKASTYFQEYLSESKPRSKLTRHSEYSAIWAYLYCSEVLGLDDLASLFAKICVGSHHKNLGNIDESLTHSLGDEELMQINDAMNYPEINFILQGLGVSTPLSPSMFCSFFQLPHTKRPTAKMRRIRRDLGLKHWLLLSYLFSILIWADKYAAIFQQEALQDDINLWSTKYLDTFVSKLGSKDKLIDHIRTKAYQDLSQNIDAHTNLYSINLPTGAGKTIASLKVAIELKQRRPILQKIIYCLPFTAIIDQNQKVFEDILSTNDIPLKPEYILAHHHLAEIAFKNDNEYSDDEARYLVETWDSELIVTTFVQAMASFMSVRNSSLKRFHRLANSIIILDEVQNIPHHYWPLLRDALKELSKQLNCVIILVTATLPLILDAKDGTIELASQKEEWFKGLNRIALDISMLNQSMEVDVLAKLILNDVSEDNMLNRLVILNTIQSSIDLYNMISDALPSSKMLYISSNVIPLQRLNLIKYIKNNPKKGLIIISTQVVEAGVDIDVDMVYRDLAPLDSIIQASGRCNRNDSKQQSKVKIIHLSKNNKAYWSYIYDHTLVHTTLSILNEYPDLIPESQIHQLTNDYYSKLNKLISGDDSRSIKNSLSSLNLGTALDYHPKETPKAFHLIVENPSQSVFIEHDKEAKKLLETYHSILQDETLDIFERRSKLKDTHRRMAPYLINVQRRLIKSDDPIFFVQQDEINLYYDQNTGFKRKADQKDYIF